MKAYSTPLQRIADSVPLAQPTTAEDLDKLVRQLAERFGLDPMLAAKEIRGGSTLARLLRAACSVPIPPRRGRGRPKNNDASSYIELAGRIDPNTRSEPSERKALKAYAQEHGIQEDAARMRKRRLKEKMPILL